LTVRERVRRWVLPLERPPAAPAWAPNCAVRLRPALQLCVLLAFYGAHVLLGLRERQRPWLRLPSFMGFGVDNLVGLVLLALFALERTRRSACSPPAPRAMRIPCEVPVKTRGKLPGVVLALGVLFSLSARAVELLEPLSNLAEWAGAPMSLATERAVEILLSHAAWVTMALHTLGSQLSPFWPRQGGQWVQMRWRSLWLWWAIGGYAGSLAVYGVGDAFSHALLPASAFEGVSLVSRLTQTGPGEGLAVALGVLAPCFSAPLFEEVLYRGFLLRALAAYMPIGLAVPVQGMLFSAHHVAPHAFIPLAALGSFWAVLYLASGNLVVCALVHALWNSRAIIVSLAGS